MSFLYNVSFLDVEVLSSPARELSRPFRSSSIGPSMCLPVLMSMHMSLHLSRWLDWLSCSLEVGLEASEGLPKVGYDFMSAFWGSVYQLLASG